MTNGGGAEEPGARHPLLGADLGTLLGALRRYGPVAPRHRPLLALFGLVSLARLPFRTAERAFLARKGRRAPPPVDPLFIVGHWRSGTTHLHNLLARALPEYGIITPLASGLPWELLTLATWLRPLLERALPEDRGVDGVPVEPDSPQEDEIPLASMQLLSPFHAVYFPRRFAEVFDRGVFFDGATHGEIRRWERRVRGFHRKVSIQQGTPRLLVKNPVYTARAGRLLQLWPGARFVHIYRNPWSVYASTVRYYRRLLPGLALQDPRGLDLESFVLERYPRLLDRWYEQSVQVPHARVTEVRFEELERDPPGVLERIRRDLGLSGWSAEGPRRYLDSVAGYRKHPHSLPPGAIERVGTAWSRYIRRWGYEPPPAPSASGRRVRSNAVPSAEP